MRSSRLLTGSDLLIIIIVASAVAIVATMSWRGALALAALPIVLWLGRVRSTWIIWALSLEMMLGGWGHLLSVGSLPVRHVLLAATLGVWVINKLFDGDWQLRGGRFAWAAAIFLAFVLVTVLVSLSLGHPLRAPGRPDSGVPAAAVSPL